MVILDTCAIIDICKLNPSVSAQTQKKINNGCYVLSASFAEIACKIKFKKLELSVTPENLYANFLATSNIEIINIGVEEWFDAIQLDWSQNKDPVDRLITAFAIKKEIPIVTKDTQIKEFYKNIIW